MSRKKVPQYIIDCTACAQSKLLAVGELKVMCHPIIDVTICRECLEFSQSDITPLDDDGDEIYCKWCTEVGVLVLCDECKTPFCKDCIVRNFNEEYYNKIESMDQWECFRCAPAPLTHLTAQLQLVLNYQDKGKINKEFTELCEGTFTGLETTQSDIEAIVQARIKLRKKNNADATLVDSEEEEEPEPVTRKRATSGRKSRYSNPKKSKSTVKRKRMSFATVKLVSGSESASPSGDSVSNDEWQGWDSDKDNKKKDSNYRNYKSASKKGQSKKKRKSSKAGQRSKSRHKKPVSDEDDSADEKSSAKKRRGRPKSKKDESDKEDSFDSIKLTNSNKKSRGRPSKAQSKTERFILTSKKKKQKVSEDEKSDDTDNESGQSDESGNEKGSNKKSKKSASEDEGSPKKEKGSKTKSKLDSSDEELLMTKDDNGSEGEKEELPDIDMSGDFQGGLTDDDNDILLLDENEEAEPEEDKSSKKSAGEDDDVEKAANVSVKEVEDIEAEVDAEIEKTKGKKRKGPFKQFIKHVLKKPKVGEEEKEDVSSGEEKKEKRGRKTKKMSLIVPKKKLKNKGGEKKRKASSGDDDYHSLSDDDVPIGQRVGA